MRETSWRSIDAPPEIPAPPRPPGSITAGFLTGLGGFLGSRSPILPTVVFALIMLSSSLASLWLTGNSVPGVPIGLVLAWGFLALYPRIRKRDQALIERRDRERDQADRVDRNSVEPKPPVVP
ncbi:hypothetical protein D9V34_14375 [Mycetocola lacteus]|uniref:Uncharacterized protein n=1 Tax=Mycetocola lacteus TaxID=76637 RepID=A0A3L7AJ55_9MICO|nr:hypothetical protein [Mycetocola lacteus]RLP80247.1 hypothetical protein D9V34_14375 [Mycetocola lacteus]